MDCALFPNDAEDARSLHEIADDAMYKAKEGKPKNEHERATTTGQAWFVHSATRELYQTNTGA